jgi:FMN phosphatase YigB (HAD superfamily)
MRRVSSFDVFDTCLTRRTAAPGDIHHDVALRSLRALGLPEDENHVQDLVAARVDAERFTRGERQPADTTLESIWTRVASVYGWPSVDLPIAHELAAEEEALVPVSDSLRLVRQARDSGDRVVFVSDMYLPSDFIRKLLIDHGIATQEDGIYVSGDVGKTKHSGDLFRHVLREEQISPYQMSHIGDHPQSDVAVPRALGIRSTLFDSTRFRHAEHRVLDNPPAPRLASRTAGAMRAYRVAPSLSGDTVARDLASQFLGPFCLALGSWILGTAQRAGIPRLYFLSRDAQLLWKVCRALAHRFGGIDCRYLYVSRQSLYLPSARTACPEEMPWMRRAFEKLPLESHLAKLELDLEDVAPFLNDARFRLHRSAPLVTDADWQSFWALLQHEPLQQRIEEKIEHRRSCAEKYFRQSGLFDGPPVVIVDLGWYLTGQSAMRNVIHRVDPGVSIAGIFLALRQGRVPPSLAGDSTALFYEPPPGCATSGLTGEILRRQTLLEHVVGLADHASVRCYENEADGTAGPRFQAVIDDAHVAKCRTVHRAVVEFAESNASCAAAFSDDETMTRWVLANLTQTFFSQPDLAALAPLRDVTVSIDANRFGETSLARSRTLYCEVLGPLVRRWPLNRFASQPRSVWPEADLAVSSRMVQRIVYVKAIASRVIRHLKS